MIDIGLVALATIAALALREDFELHPAEFGALLPYLGLTVVAAAIIFASLDVHRAIWRLTAMADYLKVMLAVALIVLAAVSLGFILNRLEGIPRSLPLIQALLAMLMLVGTRVIVRLRHARRRAVRPADGADLRCVAAESPCWSWAPAAAARSTCRALRSWPATTSRSSASWGGSGAMSDVASATGRS